MQSVSQLHDSTSNRLRPFRVPADQLTIPLYRCHSCLQHCHQRYAYRAEYKLLLEILIEWCVGPVAQNVKDQSSKASTEMSNLAASRHPPSYTAATGQPLTNYHSFFSELLSWRNPRMSCGCF